MDKRVIAVFFGGCSVEHEISIISAAAVIKNIDTDIFDVFPVYISKSGQWQPADYHDLISGKFDPSGLNSSLTPSVNIGEKKELYEIVNGQIKQTHPFDLAFPILHGTYGEDGSIQGLFEIMGVPYVGASVLGSAVGMDKIIMKSMLRHCGLPVVDYIGFTHNEWKNYKDEIISRVGEQKMVPCFVKSADLGSSVGITKVSDINEIGSAVDYSAKYSGRIIIERAVENCREIEVSVLGNEDPVASLPGEIKPSREFYDYDAKYVDDSTGLIIPAELDDKLVEKFKQYAVESFKALACSGMGRVDFLMDENTEQIFISELNTLPGFTSISMYPKLWEASGIGYKELVNRLIELAFERHENRSMYITDYESSV